MTNPLENITLKDIPTVLPLLSVAEREKLLAELEHLDKLKTRQTSQTLRQVLRYERFGSLFYAGICLETKPEAGN